MRKKSHISLAREIFQALELEGLLDHKFSFYVGSIWPDCKPSFITTPHNIHRTFGIVQEQIDDLIKNYNKDKGLTMPYCARIGIIIHYIADYFTFPHNSHYDGNVKDHCVYESKLKKELLRYIHSGEALKQKSEVKVYENTEELCECILNEHKQYVKGKSTVFEDCQYIVRVCMEVVASIIAIFCNSFAATRFALAHNS